MLLLSNAECIQALGGASSSLASPQIDLVIGCINGVLLATPFWFGVIIFGANGTADGREKSNFMYTLGQATTKSGCYLGEKIGQAIDNAKSAPIQ